MDLAEALGEDLARAVRDRYRRGLRARASAGAASRAAYARVLSAVRVVGAAKHRLTERGHDLGRVRGAEVRFNADPAPVVRVDVAGRSDVRKLAGLA